MKDSQSWKNHNPELFCCYVQPYDRDTANYFFHQEIWELEQAEYEFLRTLTGCCLVWLGSGEQRVECL